jgi:hypothetical protein
MPSVASRIRNALIERARRINGDGDFMLDVGDRVFSGPAYIDTLTDVPADKLPAVFLTRARSSGDRSSTPNGTLQLRAVRWTALLVDIADPARDYGQQVEDLIADLERAFEDPRDPLLATDGVPMLAATLGVESTSYPLDQDAGNRCYAAVDILTIFPAVYGDPAATP